MADARIDPVAAFFPDALPREITPLLEQIAAQSNQADSTRTIDADLIRALKSSDVMKLAATADLEGHRGNRAADRP